ncbi:MAG: hypothetical protein LC630_02465, partial [Bacteroidales bacterium]|nr:hypothetical protein [Bacteroidales bacterium]
MQRLIYAISFITITILSLSCNRAGEESYPLTVPTFSTLPYDTAAINGHTAKREIFYGVLTPVEISAIFSRLNAVYTPEILNDPSNASFYMSSSGAALNLGIYCTDLGYLKMFGRTGEMANSLKTIRTLSNNLGIPIEYLTEPVEELESEMADADSVFTLVNDAYRRIEDHLRESDRESRAGLMVLGGWIEAMWITTQMLFDYQ